MLRITPSLLTLSLRERVVRTRCARYSLTPRSIQRGITMIEVMVTIAVIAIVVAIGVPGLSAWMQNTQVKATAESVLTGLQLARGEAVRQNARTRFQLAYPNGTGCNGMGCWTIATDSLTAPGTFPNQVQSAGAQESGTNARLGVSTATLAASNCCATAIAAGTGMSTNPLPGIVFNAFGQVVTDASVTRITRIDVSNPSAPDARRLVIMISSSGMARLCDPSFSSSNSRGCP